MTRIVERPLRGWPLARMRARVCGFWR